MKVLLCILVSVLFANAGVIHPQLAEIPPQLADKLKAVIHPQLADKLIRMKPEEKIQVIVHMKNRASLKIFSKGTSKQQKLTYLQEFAQNDQKAILEYLSGFYDRIDNLKTYWIFNGFTFKAAPDIIVAVAQRNDIDYVIDDFIIQLEPPKPGMKIESKAIEWNIAMVNAPQCWNDGYDGSGIIVGNMDTGVDVDHPAFGGRWITGGWYDAVNSQPDPYDDNGHGTHTMGTICGGDGNGPFVDDIGIAPGANFIAAKCFNASGSGNVSAIHNCFQWFATQNAQVVSNSWGSDNTLGTEFWDDCQNWRDLGIYPVFSNGNNGAGSGTAGTPGNFPIVTGVGATDNNDDMAGFSSRGPAPDQFPWKEQLNWARPDWNLIKPDISAPGVNVRSSKPGGVYEAHNGTSMACPHVAGAVALCLQKNPGLDYITLYNILLDNADHPAQGEPYPNNDYGWGRLNCYAAINAVSPPYLEVCRIIINDTAGGNGDGQVNNGETIDFGIWVQNYTGGTAQNVSGLLSESDPYVIINTGSSWYGNIGPGDSALSNPYYKFTVASNCPDNHWIQFTLKLQDNDTTVYRNIQVPVKVPFNDIRADSVVEPSGYMYEEFSTIHPSVRFRNVGDYDENDIPVSCRIELSGSPVYTSNQTIPFLAAGTEAVVTFDNFTLGTCGSHYEAIAFSYLASDTIYANDTIKEPFAAARIYEFPMSSCNGWKYPNADTVAVPAPTDPAWIPATGPEIQQISALDSTWWVTSGAIDSAHQDIQLYGVQFDVSSEYDIDYLRTDWWGCKGSSLHKRHVLYWWNTWNNEWRKEADGSTAASGADRLLSKTKDGGAQYAYVSSSGYFYAAVGCDARQKNSCPLLFTYDGKKNVFIGDFITGADIGAWIGQVLGTNLYLPPDYDEYVKIDAENLVNIDGKYRLTINEMLQEVSYLDEIRLYVVDHPVDYDIYPHEALIWPGGEGLAIHSSEEKPLAAAFDANGRDILYTLEQEDRVYVPFERSQIDGFTKPFSLILDLGELTDPNSAVLYLYGSARFPDAGEIAGVSDIYQASKQGIRVKNPKVEVIDAQGRWREVGSCGMPAGHKKTVTYLLYDEKGESIFESQDHRLRISLTQEVYLDKAWVSCSKANDYRVQELAPNIADLHYYGYADYYSVDGKYPGDFCYEKRVARDYANVVGYYTKYGDVMPLLESADNKFVVMNHGDEIGLEFDAEELPELPEGWQRDFIFGAKGFYKSARPGRAYAYSVAPMPFYGMRDDLSTNGAGYYPYDPSPGLIGSLLGRLYAKIVWDYPFSFGEAIKMVKNHLTGKVKKAYPDDSELVEYRQEWNTRQVTAYYPDYYADLPPHLNVERVPLQETEGNWTTRLACLGVPFGDHSLHSNYIRVWIVTNEPIGPVTKVFVSAPNGGEVWEAGTTHPIKWTTTGTEFDKCRIKYSTNSGGTYPYTIATNIPSGTTSYNWTLPYINSTTCRVKIELLDASNNIVAADQSDADFTISGEPEIVIEPLSLGAVLPVGGTTSEFLTIKNIGNAALIFTIHEDATPPKHGKKRSLGQAVKSFDHDRVPEQKVQIVKNQVPGLRYQIEKRSKQEFRYERAINKGIPLLGSEDTIFYDDGIPKWFWHSAYYNYWAQRFTPAEECKVISALVMTYQTGTNACSLFVWDDAAGNPGNLVAGPYAFTGGHDPDWDRIDIPAEYIDENDFWIGIYAPNPNTPYALFDEFYDYGRTYRSENRTHWSEYSVGDVMIRAIVIGVVPVPWLSETPTQGTIEAGDSMLILISYDAAGLVEDTTYYAWLRINSNDPDKPLVIVPDTLRVIPVTNVTVSAPNGGEVWEAGTTHPVTWTTTGTEFDKCRIKYSTNSGGTYPYTIVDNLPAGATSYNWTLPYINSTTCRVKVELLDAQNQVVADDQSDTDFTIEITGPEIVVEPLSLGAALGVGDTTSQFLTIKNIGNAALTFTIKESATPPKHGKKKSSEEVKKSLDYYRVPRLAVAPIKNQVLEPMLIPQIEKRSKQEFGYELAIDKGISLLGSEDTIFYDDGTAYWYAYRFKYWAQRFTPAKECKVIGALVMTYTSGPACSLFVWDDVDGEPGNLVAGPYAYTGGHYPDWDRIDIPIPYTDVNDFWIGIYADTANGPYSLYDQHYEYGRTYRSNDRTDWSEYPLGELMLRAIVDYEEGVDPVPWLSETPTQGTIAPGDSMLILISYDAAGLVEDTTYYAWLRINSNDPDNPLVIVPDTLYITPAYAFYDDFDDGNAEGWTINALWHVTSHRSNSPSYSLAYNQESDHTYDTGARTYGQATFTVDLPSSPVIEFYHCYWTESYNGAYDICRVELLYDGTWHTLKQWDARDPNVTTWTKVALDLSAFSGTVDIRFYFDSIDRLYNNYEGWYLDNVVVKTIGKCGIAQVPELVAEQGEPRVGDLPKVYSMLQKPNPFYRITTINFALPIKSEVNLAIYNLAGQLIRRLVNEEMEPGYYNYHWDGKDDNGKKVNTGIYFCKIECGEEFKSVKKVILLK